MVLSGAAACHRAAYLIPKSGCLWRAVLDLSVFWGWNPCLGSRVINYCQESLPGNDTILWDQFPISFFGKSLITAWERESVTHSIANRWLMTAGKKQSGGGAEATATAPRLPLSAPLGGPRRKPALVNIQIKKKKDKKSWVMVRPSHVTLVALIRGIKYKKKHLS